MSSYWWDAMTVLGIFLLILWLLLVDNTGRRRR